MNDNESKLIIQSITRFLSRREHSYVELMQKLNAKGYSINACEQQLQLFVDRDIQSNFRFMTSFVRSSALKGKGPQWIRQSLKQHDIEGQELNECINDDDYNWFDLAEKVRSKKYGETLPTNFDDKKKQMRFLQYRGFEQAQIKAVFG